jgi:hypothetical protein
MITSSGLDDWIYRRLLLQPITTAHNKSTAEDSLHSRSPVAILLQLLNSAERSHVSSLYNFGKNRMEITTSNSSSIIVCLSVAVEKCLATLYRAMNVLHIVESVTSEMCLPSRCLAMIICVTLFFLKEACVPDVKQSWEL